mmetsp:Transcript_6902/g.21569  ORF Transcript_6902/g.21569 Transcript_6902/m.21569 type:complete len:207 (-) Transcript_6902:99-719(-)
MNTDLRHRSAFGTAASDAGWLRPGRRRRQAARPDNPAEGRSIVQGGSSSAGTGPSSWLPPLRSHIRPLPAPPSLLQPPEPLSPRPRTLPPPSSHRCDFDNFPVRLTPRALWLEASRQSGTVPLPPFLAPASSSTTSNPHLLRWRRCHRHCRRLPGATGRSQSPRVLQDRPSAQHPRQSWWPRARRRCGPQCGICQGPVSVCPAITI